MKKTKILLPLLVFAIVITSIVIFTGTAGADTTNATYTSQTVTMSSNGLYIGAYGTPTTDSGDFNTLAANLAGNSPSSPTLYTLTLTADVTLTEPVTIAVNENTEVIINLAGHRLTTACDGAAFVVKGTGGIVRIIGEYTSEGEWAPVVYNQTSGELVKLDAGCTAKVVLKNLDIDASKLTSEASLVSLSSGEITLNSSSVTYNASAGFVTMINASGTSSVAIKNSTVELLGTSTAVSLAGGAECYLEKSSIKADTGVSSDGTKTFILSAATDIEANKPFDVASTQTRVDILGGRITAKGGKVATGGSVYLWYGDGEMVIVGENPASYTVQTNCSFVENSGSYVLKYNGSVSSPVMQTIATIGSAPSVAFKSSISRASLPYDGITQGYEKSTAWMVTSLADKTDTQKPGDTLSTNENLAVIIDYNGYTTKLSGNGNNQIYGNINYYFDGANADGEKGGLIIAAPDTKKPMLIRARVAEDHIGATAYFNLVLTDCVFELSMVPGGNTLFGLNNGDLTVDGCSFIYSGSGNPATTTAYPFINLGAGTYKKGDALGRVRSTTFENKTEHTNIVCVSIIDESSGVFYYVDNVTENGFGCFSSSGTKDTGYIYIRNCDIETSTSTYIGTGKTYVYDTVTKSLDGNVGSGVGATFFYGEGKNKIYTSGNILTGAYSCEDGYGILMTEIGVYEMLEGLVPPSITMPSVYKDGMVLQRNKPINIRGYCETDGSRVIVTLGGNTAYAIVENGEWCATLPAMEAAYNQTLRIVEDLPTDNIIEIKNVNIGEVWVIAGQSNANLETIFLEDVLEYAELANAMQRVRIYKDGQKIALTEDKYGTGQWYTETTPATVKGRIVSAIGYVAVARIAAELGDDVPVALMHISIGSTPIKTWLDYEALEEVSPSSAEEYLYYRDVKKDFNYDEDGKNISAKDGPVGTVIYNGFLAPLKGYSIAGVMWYQGEADTEGAYFAAQNAEYINWATANGTYTEYEEDKDNSYTEFFYALEDTFRRNFGEDSNLPVYVMQLSPFVFKSCPTPGLYEFKMEQYEMCKNEPRTYLVSLATDGSAIEGAFFGDDHDPVLGRVSSQGLLHPNRKSTVGIRAADLILANEYNIKYADVYTHPEPISAVASNGVLTVTFDTELEYFYGSSAQGFEVYNGTAWVRAEGYIDGNKVILTADGVSDISGVRYGCGELLMELRDGTVIEITSEKSITKQVADDGTNQIVVTYNGKQYVLDGDSTDVTRILDYGNITNASGVPLPVFEMSVTAG